MRKVSCPIMTMAIGAMVLAFSSCQNSHDDIIDSGKQNYNNNFKELFGEMIPSKRGMKWLSIHSM